MRLRGVLEWLGEILRASSRCIGRLVMFLGRMGGILGSSEAHLGRLKHVLERLGGVLETSWMVLETSWWVSTKMLEGFQCQNETKVTTKSYVNCEGACKQKISPPIDCF